MNRETTETRAILTVYGTEPLKSAKRSSLPQVIYVAIDCCIYIDR